MHSLGADVKKLCADALAHGRAAFTYATFIRVNLAYERNRWFVVVLPMESRLRAAMGDAGIRGNARLLGGLIAEELGQGLAFDEPKTVTQFGRTGYLMIGTGGPAQKGAPHG